MGNKWPKMSALYFSTTDKMPTLFSNVDFFLLPDYGIVLYQWGY